MIDYHDLYLKKYVLVLADVFEKFTSESLKFYELDPSYYFSSPGLSWDAILKMTGITLELISDIGKHLLKKDYEEEVLTFEKDLVKQIRNTWKIMILQKKINSLCILIKTICMAGKILWIQVVKRCW